MISLSLSPREARYADLRPSHSHVLVRAETLHIRSAKTDVLGQL